MFALNARLQHTNLLLCWGWKSSQQSARLHGVNPDELRFSVKMAPQADGELPSEPSVHLIADSGQYQITCRFLEYGDELSFAVSDRHFGRKILQLSGISEAKGREFDDKLPDPAATAFHAEFWP